MSNYDDDHVRLASHRRERREEHESDQDPVPSKRRGVVLPIQVTAQEIITISGIVISLALSWGAFQTKVSLLEKMDEIHTEKIQELQQHIKEQDRLIQDLRDELKSHILVDIGKAMVKK